MANPLLTKGEGQFATTYQNNYPVGQQELVYTNYVPSNQANSYNSYVVGAGNAGTVRNTTTVVEQGSVAPPKITFNHPSGYAQNSTYSIKII